MRQLGDVVADKVAVLVGVLGEGDGRVAPVELREEGRARQPLPVADVAGGLVVDEPFLEDLGSALPVYGGVCVLVLGTIEQTCRNKEGSFSPI